jgi:predicted dehydrogenase/threonine dehydrogenase-like Zn-dependent dehydrogenase
MKQVLIRKGSVQVENIPTPLLDDNHILIEVAYSLISTGTEVTGVKRSGQSLASKAIHDPEKLTKLLNTLKQKGIKKTLALVKSKVGKVGGASPTGYSCSGIVIQVGKGVEGIKSGDPVACAGAGKANHAEIVLVPKNLVVKVPDNCSLKDAASVTLGSIAMQGVRRADPNLGETVAIIGLGLLGQITNQLLKNAGCRTIGFDLQKSRVALAKDLDLDWGLVSTMVDIQKEILTLTGGHGVDATIITASAPDNDAIVQQAMEITRKKGKVVVVGAVGLGLNRSPFYEKELDLLISTSYGPGRYDSNYEEKGLDYPYSYIRWTEQRNMQEYLKLIAEGKLNFSRLVSKIYPIDEAPQAYQALQEGSERPLAVLLDYHLSDTDTAQELVTRIEMPSITKKKSGLISVAVIGAGSFAKSVHLPNLQKLSNLYSIRAIVSATGSNAKETARQFNAAYASTHYQDVLADGDIDTVMISTRHHLHADYVLKALNAGKNVFVEKPLCVTQQELHQIIDSYDSRLKTADSRPPLLMVGFNRRFSPAAVRAKELIKDRQNPIVVNYRVNAGYIPLDHWVHGEEGGGRILGEACHMFDLFNYFTASEVESIDVSAISPKTEHVSSTDNFVTTLKYTDGSVCSLTYTALGTPELAKEYIEIYCDGKIMLIDDFKELKIYGARRKGWKGTQDKGHLSELEGFARTIREGGKWPITLGDLIQATKTSFIVDEGTQG